MHEPDFGVSRGRDLAALQVQLQRAVAQREHRFVRITAPAGYGKTTLLRTTVSWARDAGSCALHVTCGNRSQSDPLALLLDLAAAAFRELGDDASAYASGLNRALAILGAGTRPPPGGALRDLTSVPPEIVVSRLLEGIAADRPLLVAIDDAHAIAAESARAIRYIYGYLAGVPLLVLCAQRDNEPVHPDLPPCTSELALLPLPPAECRAIARAEYPDAPDEVLEAIVERTHGAPGDVILTASHARADGALSAADVSTSYHAKILRELALLEDDARTFLQFCALIGSPVEERLLRALYPDPAELARLIVWAARTYLLRDDGGFTFRNDIVMTAIRASIVLEFNLRRDIIAALAALDSGQIEDHQRIVEHATAIDDSETAFQYANRIADAALELKRWDQAASAYARALAIRWPEPDSYVVFFRRYAAALRGAMRDREAEAVLLRALRYGSERGLSNGLGRLAGTLIAVQTELEDPARAIETYERAIAVADDPLDVAELWAGIASTYASIVDEPRFDQVAAHLRGAATVTPLAMASLHQSEALLHARLGRHDMAKAALRTAGSFSTSQQSGLDYSLPLQELFIDFQHHGCDALDDPKPRLPGMSRGEELAGYWHYFQLVADFARGRWNAVRARLAQINLERLPVVQQSLLRSVPAGIAALSERRSESEPDEIALLEAASRRGLGASTFQLASWMLAGRSARAPLVDELARQVASSRKAPLGVDAICFVPVALALYAGGDGALAAELADQDMPAASRWLSAQYVFARGYCRAALGRADGASSLVAAAGAFDSLGASYFAELAARIAKNGFGARRPALERAKRRSDGLTAREAEIADLVANGKRNREIAQDLFLSERTVEVHLANVFAKLKISSRVQLARYMR